MEVKRDKDRRSPSVIGEKKMSVIIEGMEDIIERDLKKHQVILEQLKQELLVYKRNTSQEVRKKKYYNSLIGGGKYNDDALKTSIEDIKINIRQWQDNVKLTEEKITFNTNIVDTLAEQLKEQYKGLKTLKKIRDADNNRLE